MDNSWYCGCPRTFQFFCLISALRSSSSHLTVGNEAPLREKKTDSANHSFVSFFRCYGNTTQPDTHKASNFPRRILLKNRNNLSIKTHPSGRRKWKDGKIIDLVFGRWQILSAAFWHLRSRKQVGETIIIAAGWGWLRRVPPNKFREVRESSESPNELFSKLFGLCFYADWRIILREQIISWIMGRWWLWSECWFNKCGLLISE